MKRILLSLTFLLFIVYLATSAGKTPYDYFTRLADSFLHGKYYLDQNPPWLNELIPIGENKFAVVYPPAPAIVLTPFVFIFGKNFPQQILAHLMGAFATLAWGLIVYQKTQDRKKSLWMFFLVGLGNILWFLSASGSVWYLGQVSGFFFMTGTIYESLGKKRSWLIGILFALMCLSRLQLVLSLPLIIYLNKDKLHNLKFIFSFLSISIAFVFAFGLYNYLRFGSFLETGYSLIPGVLTEPWYQKGIFNLSYISSNLRVMFLSIPIFKNTFPYIIPSWGGLSIAITSPVFIYALFPKMNLIEKTIIWLSTILIAMVTFSHGGTGFTQFGYRYAVDFYPLILFLIVSHLKSTKLSWHHYFLLMFSIFVNTWGVIFINKLGFVGW